MQLTVVWIPSHLDRRSVFEGYEYRRGGAVLIGSLAAMHLQDGAELA